MWTMLSLILALHAKNRTKGKWKRKWKRKLKRNEKKLSPLPAILTLPPFKVSSPEKLTSTSSRETDFHLLQGNWLPPPPGKLTSTSSNFFSTFSGIQPQIFYHSIHTAILPYISLVTCSFCTLPFPVTSPLHLIFLQIHLLTPLHFLGLLPSPMCHFLT